VYNKEAGGCSSAEVRHSIPAVGGLISAVATPAVGIRALAVCFRGRSNQDRCQAGPWGSERTLGTRSVRGDANMPHICAAFASRWTPWIRYVAPVELGTDAFPVHAYANGCTSSVFVEPLEMPLARGIVRTVPSTGLCNVEVSLSFLEAMELVH
jgi:hypothetical protein